MEGLKKKVMLNKLKEIHSRILQKEYSEECVGPLSEQEKVLFSPYFMSGMQNASVPAADLLLWLTVWRNGFELCDLFKNIPEWKLRHLFNVLKSCLLSSNRYIAYETQRVYIAVLKKLNLQCAIEDISSQLGTTSTETLGTVYSYTEICRELLSRHNAHALLFFDHIRQSLQTYISAIFQNMGHSKFHICLFHLILILIKIVKLIAWYQHENAAKFIIKVINTHQTNLLDLLFDCNAQNGFVWRKTCRLWFKILCLIDLKGFESRTGILRQCALCIVEKIHKLGVCILYPSDVRSEQSSQTRLGFTGSLLNTSSGYNSDMRLAEGCLLCLKACECLTTRPGDGKEEKTAQEKSYTVIHDLDIFLQEAVPCDSNLPYYWLPQIFGEQDDSWIEAVLMLLNIDTLGKLPVIKTAVCLNHHHYFRQFVSSTGYDHTIIVDLLTSPETSFLTYFTKYLKYSFKTWDKFVEDYNSCGESHEIKLRTDDNEVKKSELIENSAECTAEIPIVEEIENKIAPCVGVHKQTICRSSSGSDEDNQNSCDQPSKETKCKAEEIAELTGKGFMCENSLDVLNLAESSLYRNLEKKPVERETKHEKQSQIVCKQSQKLVTGNGHCQPHSGEIKVRQPCCVDKKNESLVNFVCGKRQKPILNENILKKFKRDNSNLEGSKFNAFDVENINGTRELAQTLEDSLDCCGVESLDAILESVEYLEEESSGAATRVESRETEIESLELTDDGEIISEDSSCNNCRQEDVHIKEKLDSGSFHVEDLDRTTVSEGNKNLLHKDGTLEEVGRCENVDQQSALLLKDRLEGEDSEEQSDNDIDSLEFFEEIKTMDTRRLEDAQSRHQTIIVTDDDDLDIYEIDNDSSDTESAKHKGQKITSIFASNPSNKKPPPEDLNTRPTLNLKTENHVPWKLNSSETEFRVSEGGNRDTLRTAKSNLLRSHQLDPQFITKPDVNRINTSSELEKELETIEFQESASQDKMIFKSEDYEISDLETLLELENETQSLHSKTYGPFQMSESHSNGTYELSETKDSHGNDCTDEMKQQDHDVQQLFQDETTAVHHGLVDYVMSDEDEELIMNSEEIENAQSVETMKESEAFENNAEFLDRVMSVLIRVRIKLEKIKTAGILQYNPQPLVRLISALEEKYESM